VSNSKWIGIVALSVLMAGCVTTTQSPDVSGQIRKSLDDSGLKNISVSQDRTKGVVTLTGNVQSDEQRAQAEGIAKANSAGQVVADQIAVTPPGENEPRTVNADIDKAIGEDLDAQLVKNRLNHDVSHSEKNGVVTLKGTVNSENMRDRVAKIANGVPNVKEVVNELQIKNQKASASTHD
jgi:hyperosmotically inducible protein